MKLRSDLPLKYYLHVHNEDTLQDEFTILFDIVQYLIRVIEIKNKTQTLDSFKFSSKSMKYVFGEKLKDEAFKQNLVKVIKELLSLGHLSSSGETIHITEKGLTNFYILE